jgi:tetratricopeptide (TPR) repeat protein
LPDVPGLPKPTVMALQDSGSDQKPPAEIVFRSGLAASIKAAGAPDLDRGEPSLSALGHLIEEINFAQAIRRLEFDANMFGIPTDDLVASLRPLCAAHPYAVYLAAFQQNKQEKERAANLLLKNVQLTELTFKQRPLLYWITNVTGSKAVYPWHQVTRLHADPNLSDAVRDIDAGYAGKPGDPQNVIYMDMLATASDKLPVAVALRIQRDWPHVEHDAPALERAHADDPLVLKALENRYYDLKRYDDAERCAKRLTEVHRGIYSYQLLANVYKAKKDSTRWKESLEKALELPANGLEHASIRNEIALDLIEHKKFKEAVVYADEAAQSYSGWSMQTAGRCHELLGEWERAEQLFRAISERYENSTEQWMYWCHRTGHGDIQAADQFTRAKFEARGKTLFASQYRDLGDCYLLTGDLQQASSWYQRTLQAAYDPYVAFHVALLADRLGNATERDAHLKQLVATDQAGESSGLQHYRHLAAQMQAMLATKGAQLNFAEVDKILDAAPSSGVSASTLPLFVGVFLQNRGDVAAAKRYLIRCAQSRDWLKFNNTLACQILREMKVEIPPAEDNPKTTTPPKDSPGPRKTPKAA